MSMRANDDPSQQDEENFYDEEYDDYFDENDVRPVAVDEFFDLPLSDLKRMEIWEEMHGIPPDEEGEE